MNRLRQALLSINSLRKALGFGAVKTAGGFDFHVEIDPKLEYKNVLVLSPHPDDDVFGVGGTIRKLKNQGADITVAYFCDGEGGVLEDGHRKTRDKSLILIRQEEAKEAGKILRINKQVFYGYPDGKLGAGAHALTAFNSLISEVKPDIIFSPHFLDNHPDHRSVNEILMKAKLPPNTEIWAYEIWTPIYPNRIVNISDEIKTKQEAIATQKSQLESRGYDKAILALNQYRAEINNTPGFAESFFASTPEIYKKLYETYKK